MEKSTNTKSNLQESGKGMIKLCKFLDMWIHSNTCLIQTEQVLCNTQVCKAPVPNHFRVPKEVELVDDQLQCQFKHVERYQQKLNRCHRWDVLVFQGRRLIKILHFIVCCIQDEDCIRKNDSLKTFNRSTVQPDRQTHDKWHPGWWYCPAMKFLHVLIIHSFTTPWMRVIWLCLVWNRLHGRGTMTRRLDTVPGPYWILPQKSPGSEEWKTYFYVLLYSSKDVLIRETLSYGE